MRMLSLFIGFLLVFSCSKETPTVNNNDQPNPPFEWEKEDLIPIVMIHGMLASGDTYAQPAMLFISNKYPANYLFAFDWNTTSGNNASNLEKLNNYIDNVLKNTGKPKVVLMGHSAGGSIGYNYCSNPDFAQKIAKYIHIGSNPQSKPAGPNGEIPTLNIYSKADLIVQGAEILEAKNIVFDDLDHYQVATSEKSFEEIFKFIFPDVNLLHKEIQSITNPKISGRIISLGENSPESAVKVTMYYVDKITATRKSSGIDIKVDENGDFRDIEVLHNEYTEFVLESDREGFRTLHYYREPFKNHNPFVYLRVFPPASSLAGILLSTLPKSDEQSVVAIFSANKAIIHQRDNLIVQDIQLSNAALCSPNNSTIALFLYDNGNKISNATPHPTFNFVPFLKGANMFFDTSEPKAITLEYNNRNIAVRNYKSDTEGVIIVVFE